VLIGIDRAQDLSEGGGGLFLLSETRSAITLPLVARGEVFGVVTVQSQSPSAFGNQDLISLRAVVDQIATAVSNAQLAEELSRRLQEMATLQQYYVREAWEQFLAEEREQVYEFEQPGVASLGSGMLPEVERVLAQPELMILEEGEASAPSALVSPISLRDQVLGVLGLHRESADEPWTDDQIELIAAISEQMGLIIENSRLFTEARARATRERQAREITARMRESLEVEMVLQTAAREIGQTLQLHDVTIELTDSAATGVEG
jgi:GAF domain-containing protein